MKDLARKSYESYKSHKLTSWILGLFCGLVLTGLVILCMIDTLLLIIIVPFVLLPFLFACHMLHLSLSYEQTLTLSSFGRFFTMYFRHPFRGVFNFFQSLLRYVIASLICEAVFGLVSYIVCVSIDQSSFYQMINTFMELMMSSEGVSDLKVALGDNYSMYLIFMNVSTIPASIVSFIYFVYTIDFNANMIYLRAALKNLHPKFVNLIFKHTYKEVAPSFKKDFISLEWPLFLLMVVGASIGGVLPLLFTSDTVILTLSGVAGGLLLGSFYLPFHFANLETLYKKYEDSYKFSATTLTEKIMKDFASKFGKQDEEQGDNEEK